MTTAGIIAEYNPFHNGHQLHIEETRRRTGADYVIAVLSGDFVQRGAPALLNKYVRAEMALRHGADLVIELPITAALSSAEGFAIGGVCLLDKLHVVDVVSCGCENASEDTALFQEIVRLLADEPEEYRTLLRAHTKAGAAFPRARELAVSEYFRSIHPDSSEVPDKTGAGSYFSAVFTAQSSLKENVSNQYVSPGLKESISRLLSSPGLRENISRLLSFPNNILAIEYAKAIHTLSTSMELCLVPRKGGAYHSAALSENFSSATAIRRCLLPVAHDPDALSEQLKKLRTQVPSAVCDTLLQAAAQKQCLSENDFSGLLFYSLIQRDERLDDYCPSGSDLACRIRNSMEAFTDWQEFALLVKSRNRTYTAVSRCLAHILLDLTEDDFAISAEYGHAPYARVLGFRRDAAPLLKAIQAQADIPLLMHPAKDLSRLDEKQARLFKKNVQASEIYKHILYQQSGFRLKSEFRQPLIIL